MKLPLFFPNTIRKIIAKQESKKPRYYNLVGQEIVKPAKTLDISQPIYDFQAGTTATITTETLPITPVTTGATIPTVVAGVDTITPEPVQKVTISVVTGYCVKCKCKREVHEPVITNMDTKKGVKGILRGSCVICGTKMGAIVKAV